MPKVKDFYHRIDILDECFRYSGKRWNISDLLDCVNKKLQDRFEETISKRTLQYALEYLINEKGAPVEKRKEGTQVFYYYADANYSIKNLPLTDEEIVLLKDAVALIKEIGSTAMAQEIVAVVQKLENTIANNNITERTIVQFEKHTIATGMEHLDNLFSAIKENLALEIIYQPFGKDEFEQIVHPYLLKEYRNRWFLIARDEQHQSLCNLALDRIKKVKPAKLSYKPNDLFDPQTYFNNLIGVTFPVGEEVLSIVLKVKKAQVPYIKTKPIHFIQETEEGFEDSSMLVKLKLINNYELRSVLLSYGADVEVLQPEALRQQMAAIYNEIFSLYH